MHVLQCSVAGDACNRGGTDARPAGGVGFEDIDGAMADGDLPTAYEAALNGLHYVQILANVLQGYPIPSNPTSCGAHWLWRQIGEQ